MRDETAMPDVTSENLFILIDEYKELLDYKDELKEMTADNNKDIEKLRDTLSQEMVNAECQRIARNGFMYSLCNKTKYSKRSDVEEAKFFDTLRENALGGLIKESVAAQTLQAAMKEVAEENGGELPEAFVPCINAYEYTDIQKRKI